MTSGPVSVWTRFVQIVHYIQFQRPAEEIETARCPGRGLVIHCEYGDEGDGWLVRKSEALYIATPKQWAVEV